MVNKQQTLSLYIDGQLDGRFDNYQGPTNSACAGDWAVGYHGYSGTTPDAHMNDLRVYKWAKYSDSFTPEPVPYLAIEG